MTARRRVLHVVRPGQQVPPGARRPGDRVVDRDELDAGALCDAIFAADVVIVW